MARTIGSIEWPPLWRASGSLFRTAKHFERDSQRGAANWSTFASRIRPEGLAHRTFVTAINQKIQLQGCRKQ
jgi:hypothetical protein